MASASFSLSSHFVGSLEPYGINEQTEVWNQTVRIPLLSRWCQSEILFNFPVSFLICVGVIIITAKIAVSGLLTLKSVSHIGSICAL